MTRLGGKYDECAESTQDFLRNAYEQSYNWTSYTLQVYIIHVSLNLGMILKDTLNSYINYIYLK